MTEDLNAALRSLRSSTRFTTAALIVLTLGIGATTAVFSVVDAVVLRGLPFDEPERLVAVGETSRSAGRVLARGGDPEALGAVAPQNYLDWAAHQQVFESIAAIASGWFTLREPGAEPESLVPQRVTTGFFQTLRVRPAIGRQFTAADEIPGRDRVVILSDGLWRRRFGADPRIVGRTIPIEDLERGTEASAAAGYEVVGVMPPDFAYPVGVVRATELWVPYVVPNDQRVRQPHQVSRYLQVIARLKPGVALGQARAQMAQLGASIEAAHPVWNREVAVGVRPLADHIVGARIRSWMLLLLGAVGVVLVIACANIATLLLARGADREREVAVRAALGASRWRLVRQLMTESLVLSGAGTACAILVAWWAVQVLRDTMPEGVPRATTIALDLRVLAAAGTLSLVTGALFGILPAWQLSKPDLARALKQDLRTGAGAGVGRLRQGLVVGEVALAVVLLVGAALFIGSFVKLIRIDPGFRADHVLTAQVSPRVVNRTEPQDAGPALAAIVERLSRAPGIQLAAMADGIPLTGGTRRTTITIPGTPFADLASGELVGLRQVTPAYHQVLRIPLRRGRLFSEHDRRDAAAVVILSEAAAQRYFPGHDPIGRTVVLGGRRTVVGVVGNVHQGSLESEPAGEAYVPMAQSKVYGGMLLVRTSGEPEDALPSVRAAGFAVLPDVPLRNVRTMDALVAVHLAQRRLTMWLLGMFGLLGLAIAVVGVYGVLAHLVSQRRREIGVRMALGATRGSVFRMVLRDAAVLVAAGLAIGGTAAWFLRSVSTAFLFGVEPGDPRAFAGAGLLLAAAAVVASVLPARRAADVDPIEALRAE